MYFGAAAIAAGTQNPTKSEAQKSKFGENRVRVGLTKYHVGRVHL